LIPAALRRRSTENIAAAGPDAVSLRPGSRTKTGRESSP
jgi:hypothetical protein